MVQGCGNLCPFVREPFEACHVWRMDSQAITETVHYCAGFFVDCVIYRQAVEEASAAGGQVAGPGEPPAENP